MIGFTAFTDESGFGERYLCYGGVFVPTGLIAEAEASLSDYASRRGFASREISWKKCSRNEVDRYAEFASLFWLIDSTISAIDFRSLVIDVRKYALEDVEFGCHKEEDGFYRFYHQFLTRSFALVAKDADECELRVAASTDQYPYRTAILNATVVGTLREKLGDEIKVTEIQRDSPKACRLHQLADVLLGAVSFRFNRHDNKAPKSKICRALEEKVGQSLNTDFRPEQRPFNVWQFVSKGHLAR